MRTKLSKTKDGVALVLPQSTFELGGIDIDAEVEVTTNGRALFISSLPPQTPPIEGKPDLLDPHNSSRLIRELRERFGLQLEHFRKIHHFGPTASIENHLAYCDRTSKFRPGRPNVDVAERLYECLMARREGKSWDAAIKAALQEVPLHEDDVREP